MGAGEEVVERGRLEVEWGMGRRRMEVEDGKGIVG